jgi:hypothetical protein
VSLVLFDFCCPSCGAIGEELVEVGTKILPCACGGEAVQIWMKAPGVGNKAKGKFPYYDTGLAMTVESPQQRERIAKSKGLAIMGREEFARSVADSKAPVENYIDREKWRESAQKAWQDIKSQAVPLNPATPMAKVDATPIGTNT